MSVTRSLEGNRAGCGRRSGGELRWDAVPASRNPRPAPAPGAPLRRSDVTHLYFGPYNRTAIRRVLGASQGVVRVYAADNVEIFVLR